MSNSVPTAHLELRKGLPHGVTLSENDHPPRSQPQTSMSQVVVTVDLEISPIEKYIGNTNVLIFFVFFPKDEQNKTDIFYFLSTVM